MSADDQTFLDTLSSVPNDIKRYSGDVADYVDKHLEKVSNIIREALSSSEWIPSSHRPRPPPPPAQAIRLGSKSTLERVYTWTTKNKLLTGVILLTTGGFIYYVVKGKSRKKRRAKRAANGARTEVVVVAGSPVEPITRSISLDLERRGFVVYVVCNSVEEEELVQKESRSDIKPLMIDIVDPESSQASIERFTAYFKSSHTAFQGARPHQLSLRSLVIIPSQDYPSAPLSTIHSSTLSDFLNTRLLTPLLVLKTFLPLLHTLALSQPSSTQEKHQQKPSVLVLTPSIIASLSPAFHLPESAIVSALTTSVEVVASELSPLSIPVTHLQLGTFDLSSFLPHHRQHHPTAQSQRAETLTWDETSRQAYAKNFVAVTSTGSTRAGRGSSLRELNDAVFDAMYRRSGGVVTVGKGMGTYSFVGRWVPRGLVGWMMGLRKTDQSEKDMEFGKGKEVVLRSRSTSPESVGGGYPYTQGPGIFDYGHDSRHDYGLGSEFEKIPGNGDDL